MRTVFLSYKQSSDKGIALRIQKCLNDLGYLVIRDESALPNGQYLKHEITNKIRRSDCFLLCHSQESLRSNWVQWECGVASGQEAKRKLSIKIYNIDGSDLSPVMMGRLYENIPPGLSNNELSALLQKSFPEIKPLKPRWHLWAKWGILLLILILLASFIGNCVQNSNNYIKYPISWLPVDTAGISDTAKPLEVYVKGYDKMGQVLMLNIGLVKTTDKSSFLLSTQSKLFLDGQEMFLTDVILWEDGIKTLNLASTNGVLLGEDLSLMKTGVILYFEGNRLPDDFEKAHLKLVYKNSAYGFHRTVNTKFESGMDGIWDKDINSVFW